MTDGHWDATINQYFIYSLALFTLCLPHKYIFLIFADTKNRYILQRNIQKFCN